MSYPGSGNTWTRILLEDITGIYTGSIYKDGSLTRGGFKGEGTNPMKGQTMIVKSHFPSNQKVMHAAKAIIFVVRNPFDAIIAEYKRRRGHGHTSVVRETVFKDKMWLDVSSTLFVQRFNLSLERPNMAGWLGKTCEKCNVDCCGE